MIGPQQQTSGERQSQSRISTPVIQLPEGGGSLKGIGETFEPSAFTGDGSWRFSLPLPDARGMTPELTISYSSGSGNGLFGLGFSLSLSTISRRTDLGLPRYNDEDTFVLSGEDHLVPFLIENQSRWIEVETEEDVKGRTYKVKRYRPRTEKNHMRIERWLDVETHLSHWEVRTGAGVKQIYGRSENARVADPNDPRRIFQWNLEEVEDALGNKTVYEYQAEDGENIPDTVFESNRAPYAQRYLHRVRYGNYRRNGEEIFAFEAVLNYGEYDFDRPYLPVSRTWPSRQDPFSSYRSGFEIRTHRLCHSILLYHHFEELGPDPVLVRSLNLSYDEQPLLTVLKQVQLVGYRPIGDEMEQIEAPPIQLDYTAFAPKGRPFEALQYTDQRLPGYAEGAYQPVDLYGEGIAGILYSDPDTVLYFSPLGDGQYAPPIPPDPFPLPKPLADGQLELVDLDGDGMLELVVHTGTLHGYYAVRGQEEWDAFRPFTSWPTDVPSPLAEPVDIDGDGRTDMVLNEGPTNLIYYSKGEAGYGPGIRISKQNGYPTNRHGDEEELLAFANIFGDGMDHRVRIRNGSVECWPNMGYGQFGAPVRMANAPHFDGRFEASRLRLADLDGSGTTDLIYLHSTHADLYLNQSGNSFSEPVRIDLPVAFSHWDQVQFADVTGFGTSSLVITNEGPERHHVFCDFSAGIKPYLLHQIDNGRGAFSRIRYTSSTRFYLEDKAKGKPWATRLPFPVQVVEKMETIDQISGTKLVSRFAYHHGHFDGTEREFRGFGMVERWDTEGFEQYNTREALDVPFETIEQALHAVPIYTRTWYHTGAFLEAKAISRHMATEYYAGDADAHLLPDSFFETPDDEADADSLYDAYRALHGLVIRKEVYGLDGNRTAEAPGHPYTVTESNTMLRRLQPKAHLKAAAYQAFLGESLEYAYERNPADPRVSHTLNLEYDAFGHALTACQVAYGRRPQVGVLHAEEQLVTHVTCHCNIVANESASFYRLGIPVETREFELGGVTPDGTYFGWEELRQKAQLAQKQWVRFSEAVDSVPIGARLITWNRSYYWDEAQTGPLALAGITARSLLHHEEVAFLDEAGLADLMAPQVDAATLAGIMTQQGGDGGGFRLSEGYWWNPGDTAIYGNAEHYHQVKTIIDPHDATTEITYDPYDLHAITLVDPAGNRTVAECDYHSQSLRHIIDPNENVTEAGYDAFGQLRLISRQGTEDGEVRGDRPLEQYESRPIDSLEGILASPHDHLQGVTSFYFYDHKAWVERQQPLSSVHITRQEFGHVLINSEQPALEISLQYSDGFGRELQLKKYVEPGPALQFEADGTSMEVEVDERWLTSGRIVYNNKGKPVKQYEPFYSTLSAYVKEEGLASVGVTSISHYDPLERIFKTDTAKGFFSRILFSPWEIRQDDPNDTVLESFYMQVHDGNLAEDDQDALDKAREHANTPTIQLLDGLGRPFREIEQERIDGPLLITHTEIDIQGNTRTQTDPRLFQSQAGVNLQTHFAMTGQSIRQSSVDAGTQWLLYNTQDSQTQTWDERGFHVNTSYDLLQRVLAVRVQGNGLNHIVERFVYGESVENAAIQNLRGEKAIRYDRAGRTTFARYAFTGDLIESRCRFRQNYKQEANWSSDTAEALESDEFVQRWRVDAQGRKVEAIQPDASRVEHHFHPSGRLNAVLLEHAGATSAQVASIQYNSRGQRDRIVYGNGISTSYSYDANTFELRRLESRRSDDTLLQDTDLTYDPAGNITRIRDHAQERIFGGQQVVDPLCDYTYDALYRLRVASGREHPALYNQHHLPDFGQAISIQSGRNDQQAIRNYRRTYTYDDANNLTQIRHAGQRSFTRDIELSADSNRGILKTENGPASVDDHFDVHGNLLQVNHLDGLEWDYRNQLAVAYIIKRPDAVSDAEYYLYDAQGRRARKVLERLENGSVVRIEETLYFDDYEVKRVRTVNGPIHEERLTTHIKDDKRRIALARQWTVVRSPDQPRQTYRLQLSNHLPSSVLEVDEEGALVTFEEYFPYGDTALMATRGQREIAEKNYRFSGKERDNITGFYYYGARYYVSWIGRWLNPDPAGTVDGLNLFRFVSNNPITTVDETGNEGDRLWELGGYDPARTLMTVMLGLVILFILSKLFRGNRRPYAREFGAWNNQNAVDLQTPFGPARAETTIYGDEAPHIKTDPADFGGAQMLDARGRDASAKYEAQAKVLGRKPKSSARSMSSRSPGDMSDVERRAATQMDAQVHFSERWRKEGAQEIFQAFLKLVDAGIAKWGQIKQYFQFADTAKKGRRQILRIQRELRGESPESRNPLTKQDRELLGVVGGMRETDPDDLDSDDEDRERKPEYKSYDRVTGYGYSKNK